ncbi:hypothetical protein HZ994_09405 [Akkermansiaceae bacterium]|nr:hypothetical protein HZ994_09405 [Akkermansiaceae bacterium]
MNSFGIPVISGEGLGAVAVAYGALILIVHIIMAFVVSNDAKRLESEFESEDPFLFIPLFWGLLAFVFGIAGLALYWAVHYSSLRSRKNNDDE